MCMCDSVVCLCAHAQQSLMTDSLPNWNLHWKNDDWDDFGRSNEISSNRCAFWKSISLNERRYYSFHNCYRSALCVCVCFSAFLIFLLILYLCLSLCLYRFRLYLFCLTLCSFIFRIFVEKNLRKTGTDIFCSNWWFTSASMYVRFTFICIKKIIYKARKKNKDRNVHHLFVSLFFSLTVRKFRLQENMSKEKR